jgi:hypothetical protein
MKKLDCNELRSIIKESVVGPEDLLQKNRHQPKLTRARLRQLIKEELETTNRPGGVGFGVDYKHVAAMAEFDPKHIDDIVKEFESTMLDLLDKSPDAFSDPKTGDYGPFAGKDSTVKNKRVAEWWQAQVNAATDDLRHKIESAAQDFKDTLSRTIEQVEDNLHDGDYN